MTATSGDDEFEEPSSTHPLVPQDPEFYRRVLEFMHTPLLIVDGEGNFVYMNHALLALGGWERDQAVDRNFLDFVHPQDREPLAASFLQILSNPHARILGGIPWAPVYFRLIANDGSHVPIELVGSGGLMDPVVGGIIYEVRPARNRNLLGRVLDGLSQGASMFHLLSLVGEKIASPPLDLHALILQSTPDGGFIVATSTSLDVAEAFRSEIDTLPWDRLESEPLFVDPSTFTATLRDRVAAAGFQDVWIMTVHSPLTENSLRIVVASPNHHVPPTGPYHRLVRSRELAAAVLLRTQADELLDYAAAHDPLTDLPNRTEFYQLTGSLDALAERAALHLDLDGLKRVNTQLGQASGDAVLSVVADRLRAICSPDDIIGRIGDDEFTIVLTASRNTDSSDESLSDRAVQMAAELLAAIKETVVVAGRPLQMSSSIGVAIASPGVATDTLLAWADAAMHDAKVQGGGRICRFGVGYGSL